MSKWKAALSCGLVLIFFSHFSLSTVYDYDDEDQKLDAWSRCPWIRNKLKNGRVRIRSRGRIAKFSCKSGYDLVGKRFATCVRGQWNNPVPICITKGCRKPRAPTNGKVIELNQGAALSFDCSPGYSLVGASSIIYCDGNQWDKDTPKCQVTTFQPQTSCDFEEPDICGWTHDPTHHFDWRRNQFSTPSGHVGTGPSYDHTYGKGKAGFYMYEEASAPRNENDTSRLFSPVYSRHYSPGCFVFWYHMHGVSIGALRVYIKKESSVLAELTPSWELRGEQGNQWFRGNVTVPLINENFQVVIEGIRGSSHVGDTAIDDVSLLSTDCSSLDSSNSTSGVEASADSCRGRCHELENSPSCGCTEACESNNTCCPDYSKLCAEKTETSKGEDEYLPTTAKMETDGAPELTAVDKVGTPLTVTPAKLYTEEEANMTMKNTQQLPVTEHIPTVTTVLPSTGTASLTTNKPTTIRTKEEITTKTTLLPTVSDGNVPVNTKTTEFVNVTSRNTPKPTSKEQTTALKMSTVASTVLTTVLKESTAITIPATTTTAATTKQLPAIIQTSGSSTPPEATVTDSKITGRATSKVPATETAKVTSRTYSSSNPSTKLTGNSVSSERNLVPQVSTRAVAMSTTTTLPIVSVMLTSKITVPTTATTRLSISSPKTTPYTTVINTQASGTSWKTLTSLKIIPEASKTATTSVVIRSSSVVPKKTTPNFVTTLGKTVNTVKFPLRFGSTAKNIRRLKTSTKQSSLYLTTGQPVRGSSERNDAHASKTKADMPGNHSPSVTGICVGTVLIAGLVGGVAYVFLRRRRQAQSKLRDDSEMRFLPDSEVIEYSDASAADRLVHS